MEKIEVIDKNGVSNNVCTVCQKLLNVAPIFRIENNELVETICGRCVDLVDTGIGHKKRQYVYENLAKFIAYPCCNKKLGCSQILRWDKVEEHERVCSFTIVNCPLYYVPSFSGETCSWKGTPKSLDTHIKDQHKDCVLPSFDWTDFKSDMLIFIPVEDYIIVALMKYINKRKRYCLVMLNGTNLESQCYRYKLEFFADNGGASIILSKNRLQPLSKLQENINNNNIMLEVDLVILETVLKNLTNVYYNFNIMKKTGKEIKQIIGSTPCTIALSSGDRNNDKIIQFDKIKHVLKCKACSKVMMPPIYVSNTGNSKSKRKEELNVK